MMDQAVFQILTVADCIPTGDNPRQVSEESEKFGHLLFSVKAEGVKEPVKVRPHPSRKGKYDLRDGARRHRAAQMAGLKEIPALVYEHMTDAEAFDLTFDSFFGREDLSPIEEAKAVALLLEKHGDDIAAVAGKLGQTERWVKLRANVYENLTRGWIEAVEKNEDGDFDGWTISHMALIARFDKETQKRLLEDYSRPFGADAASVADLEKWCQKQLRLLKNVPWGLRDELDGPDGEELPICDTCPKRSGAERLLWEFEADPDEDRCLDSACFAAKQTAAVLQRAKRAKAEHPGLRMIAVAGKNEMLDYRTRQELPKKFPGVEFERYETGKKSDPQSFPCMVMAGKSAGKIVWRKPASSGGSSGASSRKRGGSTAPAAGPGKSMEQKREHLGRKRWAQVLTDLHKQVAKCGIDAIVYEDKLAAIVLLVWQFGVASGGRYGAANGGWREDFEAVRKVLAQSGHRDCSDMQAVLADIWLNGVRPKILGALSYCGPITQTPDAKIEAAGEVGKLLGIDIDALHAKACRDIPEPKSWSKAPAQAPKESADPTPVKKVRGRPKKKAS